MNCINIKSQEFQELLEATKLPSLLLEMKISKWQELNGFDRFPTINEILQSEEVNFILKSINILQLNKSKEIFDKGIKNNWSLDKILSELQIPKDQKELILQSRKKDIDDIITDLLSNYSYSIEINTSKIPLKSYEYYDEMDSYYSDLEYYEKKKLSNTLTEDDIQDYNNLKKPIKKYSVIESISGTPVIYFDNKEDAIKYAEKLSNKNLKNSEHYINLTVPGGTNYQENEIATPTIIPSIKGHAQFSTSNGIGWFRSDEQISSIKDTNVFNPNYSPNFSPMEMTDEQIDDYVNRGFHKAENLPYITTYNGSKTRRILEVQSDLFQKGRDRRDLIKIETPEVIDRIGFQEDINKSENKFLQLLNKDNNWVTFFVKSIIQDSAKKGYEKVLFPTGNTASKVEGHSTLEEFKEQKKNRIKELEKQKETKSGNMFGQDEEGDYPDDNIIIGRIDHEIDQLKKEIKRVEIEGFGALKPIYNFYENTVTNILNKTYGKNNVKVITDEYGNTWNELILENQRDKSSIFLKEQKKNIEKQLDSIFQEENIVPENNTSYILDILFDNKKESNFFTVNEILNNIINNVKGLSEETLDFINSANKLIKKSKATIKIVSELEMVGEDTIMQYESDNNEIQISKERLQKFSNNEGVIAFLHEVVHSVTVHSMLKDSKDRTFAEQQLVDVIDAFMNKYKDTTLSKRYGFTDKFEFVAEFYANPEFRNEVKETSNSWWNKLLDAIRRVFGSPKNPEYTKLYETIINFVEGNHQDFYGIVRYDKVFSKKTENKIELDTISKKIDYALENIKQRVKHAYFKARDSKSKRSKEFAKHLKELNKELELFKGADKLKGILKYVESFNITVNTVNNLLNKLLTSKNFNYNNQQYFYDENGFFKTKQKNSPLIYHQSLLNNIEDSELLTRINSKIDKGLIIIDNDLYDNILKSEKGVEISAETLYQYQDFLQLFDSIKDIDKILTDSKANIKELGVDERLLIEEINNTLNTYRNDYLNIYNVIESLKRNILIDKLSNPIYNTEVEVKWKNKLSNEYDKLNITDESKTEYINRKLNTTNKEDYENDLHKSAIDLIQNPTIDIKNFDLYATDSLNIKSRIVQMATNMVQEIRSKIISEMKPFDIQISTLHKRFMKDKSGAMSDIFKNIYEQDNKGNFYLARKYSVKFKDNYEKLIKDILFDKNNKLKILNIQKHNVESLKDNQKTISIRKPNEHSYEKDNILKVVSQGNLTGDLVKVKKIHTFSNFKSLSSERKDIFARLMGDYQDYSDFISKNDYLNPDSLISKTFPNMFKMINGEVEMDVIEYELLEEKGDIVNNYVEETSEYKKWIEENTKIVKTKQGDFMVPNDSYLNNLSKDEEKLVQYFSQITKDTNNATNKKNSLIKNSFGIDFYKIPSQAKGDTEYILEGQFKPLLKDKLTDLTSIKAGEVGYEQLDNKGDIKHNVKIHFRNKIKPEEQSLDLFTVYRNEKWNGLNYFYKKNAENSFKLLLDVIKNKQFIKQNSFGEKLINKYNKNYTPETFDGEFSNELKKIEDLIETNIYDILHKSAGNFFGADGNKLISTVSGMAASVAMTGNIPGAVANLTNGYTQLMFQAFGGKNISLKSLGKAEKILNADIFNVIKDISNPIKTSYTNQILEMFDVLNNFDQRTQDFIKNTVSKSLLDKRNMNALSDIGELKMNAMLTMSVLDGLKVMNANHKFIDKEGNEVSEEKAASLLDMIYKNDLGILEIDKKVAYTPHNLTIKIEDGGKIHISNLIKKKGYDMFGVYSPEFASKMSKTFWGKSLLMFKKYLLPGLKARYRGISSAHKFNSDLTEDDLFYSSAEKEYIEGYYTTFIRALINIVKSKSLNYSKEYYNSLSSYEKSNLKKASIELVTTMILLPLIGMLLSSAADDEDDELTYFLAYQVRRLESEISSFRNPNEAYKVLNNPLASVRFIQNCTKLLQDVLTPINFNPENNEQFFDYLSEDRKHNNTLWKHTLKTVPLFNQFNREYKEMLNFIENKSAY
jgi:hypothetical protein